MTRSRVSTGTPWESKVGYCRAIRTGRHIFVAGTTASDENGDVVSDSAYEQTRFILDRIERALHELAGSMDDVVRTRMYIIDFADEAEIGRAHAERFSTIRPAATMVKVSGLIDPAHRVEIEVDAIVDEDS